MQQFEPPARCSARESNGAYQCLKTNVATLMQGHASTHCSVGAHQPVCQLRIRQLKGLDGAVTAGVPRGGFKGAQHSAGAGRGACSAPQTQCWVVSTKQAANTRTLFSLHS